MRKPLTIFIVGTTAVGKTKLSIELSKALGGEVINSDSKQLYRHADIMTAKACSQEKEGIPHHLLDCLQLSETSFNRNKYYMMAKNRMEDIQKRQKIPIVVGGTNYYVQTLLYNVEIEEKPGDKIKDQEQTEKVITKQQIEKMTKQEKLNLLAQIDPLITRKLHPNDQNRITNFLNRYAETNIPPSSTYKPYTHNLRHPDTLLFWLRNSNREQLKSLMSQRIMKMLKQGGLHQIISIFEYSRVHGIEDGGALQSIGYKQFQQFYEAIRPELFKKQSENKEYNTIYEQVKQKIGQLSHYLTLIEQLEADSSLIKQNQLPIVKLLQRSIQRLELNTVQYSRRQVTWIKNRIFSQENQSNQQHFFVLELSGVGSLMERFDKQIKQKALQIIQKIQQQGFGSLKEDKKHFTACQSENLTQWKKYKCQQCVVEVNGKHEWEEHLKSKKHRGFSSKKKRKQEKIQKKMMIRQEEERRSLEQGRQEEPKDAKSE